MYWPNYHRRNGSMDEHKHLDHIYEKQKCWDFFQEHLFSLQSSKKMHISVMPVFHSGRVQDSFKLIIHG